MGFSFRLGDEDNDAGHRGFDGVSGWGWLTHGSGGHVESSDWLFTVGEEIPEPATLLMVLGGLAFSSLRRFRS